MAKRIFESKWKTYGGLFPLNIVENKLDVPFSFLPEELQALLPSVELSSDGPVVDRVIMLTENYLCDVRVRIAGNDFDFALLRSIANYRIDTAETTQELNDTVHGKRQVTFKHAHVTLVHSSFQDYTLISYVGDSRDEWLKDVLTAIPLTLLHETDSM